MTYKDIMRIKLTAAAAVKAPADKTRHNHCFMNEISINDNGMVDIRYIFVFNKNDYTLRFS